MSSVFGFRNLTACFVYSLHSQHCQACLGGMTFVVFFADANGVLPMLDSARFMSWQGQWLRFWVAGDSLKQTLSLSRRGWHVGHGWQACSQKVTCFCKPPTTEFLGPNGSWLGLAWHINHQESRLKPSGKHTETNPR